MSIVLALTHVTPVSACLYLFYSCVDVIRAFHVYKHLHTFLMSCRSGWRSWLERWASDREVARSKSGLNSDQSLSPITINWFARVSMHQPPLLCFGVCGRKATILSFFPSHLWPSSSLRGAYEVYLTLHALAAHKRSSPACWLIRSRKRTPT
jgi:hypothetical protein